MRLASLSEREKEVLRMVAEGMSNQAIGDRLHISIRTVEAHRSRVMLKLNLASVAELVRYAVRHRMIEP
jgi:DNA-binding CsgD family transcriptional regulator